MARRPTIIDLARESGLSIATVDRALNGRPNVSDRAIARVAESAEKIGFYGAGLALMRAAESMRPKLRLGFVLQKPEQYFYQNLGNSLDKEARARVDVQASAVVTYPATQSAEDYERVIKQTGESCDAIAVVAPNLPQVSQALGRLRDAGKPVFTMLNDLGHADRLEYFGTDNLKVGRIAAWMLTTHLRAPGKLAVFVGSSRWHSHMLRETGFQSYLRDHAPTFEKMEAMINLDTRQLTYEATIDLLDRTPELRGMYIAGGGMEGAIAALREVRPPGKIALVVNELTPESRAALSDRYVVMAIGTPVRALSRACVQTMIDAAFKRSTAPQTILPSELHVTESV
ncbi:LacI family transcriptional regulator [Phaeobacter inhibens]|nr:LacI family transcriptional regulator [Phaeobacter inhibens]